ncbi:hypothetical protein T01_7265, partial [Trichinella spiralis]
LQLVKTQKGAQVSYSASTINGKLISSLIMYDEFSWSYVSNKWPVKLPCAYLNTQESRHTGTPLKWNKGG